ncbi:MAG TPA: cytochrome d ubiquinol oxidase subunit II [Deltaproteobacteria bacterium]|nr:cytochrome d ubiquinol oxidase subunit II [Deltaproteobacteria bacterium]
MLETIWFALWGILWAIYFMLDGFDLGVGMLLPFLGKGESERQEMISSITPFWDGNEVWLITAGGVTFAAFPAVYAVLFSSFYSPLMLILFGLIVRAVSIEFRNKRPGSGWRSFFDLGIFLGSFIPALLFGVAFANIFKGIPFDGEGIYYGSTVALLNPYGLAGGLFFTALFLFHGSLWVATSGNQPLQKRARSTALVLWFPLCILAVTFLILSASATTLWKNYLVNPWLLVVPIVCVAALFLSGHFVRTGALGKASLFSFVLIACAVLFGVAGLYPALLPSSLGPTFSLTIANGASSQLTLKIMLIVVVAVLPIVVAYQTWVYFLFRRKPKAAEDTAFNETEQVY